MRIENNNRLIDVKIDDIIGNIVDHNSIVALWVTDWNDPHYSNLVWRGEGWKIPDPYNNYIFEKIFSSVPETIEKGDVVNIQCHSPYIANKKIVDNF